jgi:hypothetical protein
MAAHDPAIPPGMSGRESGGDDMAQRAQITFEKVHCVRDTRGEWGKDEIFFAVFPTVIRRDGGRMDLQGYLSTIQGAVVSGVAYTPQMVIGAAAAGNQITLDVSDATELLLPIALYEADQQAHYNRLRQDPKFANVAPEAGWGDAIEQVQKLVQDARDKKWAEVIFGAFKIVVVAIRAIGQDDLIDLRPIMIQLDQPSAAGPREYTFKGLGSEYRVAFRVDFA